jgi:hypothetical protein
MVLSSLDSPVAHTLSPVPLHEPDAFPPANRVLVRVIGTWHCSDAVTRRRALASTRQKSGRWRVRDRVACSLPVSTASL